MNHKFASTLRLALLLALACALLHTDAFAQRANSKPPAPNRIVADYVKAIGGRKRLVVIKDATYEWHAADASAARTSGAHNGTARTQSRHTGALRSEVSFTGNEGAAIVLTSAATPRVAWKTDVGGVARTLTDGESSAARLTAALTASRLFDYKAANVLARTLGRSDAEFERTHGEAAYIVEFTARDNTRVRAWFGVKSRLLLRFADDANRRIVRYSDYRPAQAGGVLEPHRIEIVETLDAATPLALVLTLRAASYNANLSDALFDPPPTAGVDLNALLREVTRRQRQAENAFDDYTYRIKETQTTLGAGGVVKKQRSFVREIVIAKNGRGAGKLVMRDDQPLPPAEAAKEDARITALLEKLESEPAPTPKPQPKKDSKAEDENRSGGFTLNLGEFKLRLTDIIRIAEFIAPRREAFKGREAIVFDFTPRKGFRPTNRSEEAISKLRGVMWIDPVEKIVMRFEARLTDSFKIGGGFLMNIRPGASLTYEAARLPQGLWVPRLYQINANGKALLFSELNILETWEWSDFKRFRAEAGEAIITSPTDTQEQQP
jgi:hypothetical protein